MPNKTIYVPDDKLHVFNQVRELTGGHISVLIMGFLEEYLRQKLVEMRIYAVVTFKHEQFPHVHDAELFIKDIPESVSYEHIRQVLIEKGMLKEGQYLVPLSDAVEQVRNKYFSNESKVISWSDLLTHN